MIIDWIKCGDAWYSLHGVNLSSTHFNNLEGVYIVWQAKGPVVRVGQGLIKDRIQSHREDEEINAFTNLYVTWASVSTQSRDGIERYLAEVLNPKVGSNFPNIPSVAVNLPWRW